MANQLFTRREFRFSLKTNIPITLLCLISISSRAQVFTGTVKGSDGAPLVQATLVGIDRAERILAYTTTNEQGQYSLSVPDTLKENTLQAFKVSYLGYQTKVIPPGEMKDSMTIVLRKDKFTLKEVTVRAKRIQASGDTLTYSVAGFRQGQDRSIGDVIAKMPGMEVSSDGSVKFQGKAINKFYIEGLDLMGSQYGVANKNIPADKIQNVQVLQNHQPVKSLHGVQFSDQAALNLVLTDDAKAVWSGTMDLGAGYGQRFIYDNRALGLYFNKQFQTLMLYKNNNTGKDISTEVRDLVMQSQSMIESEDGLLSLMEVSVPNMKQERHEFNRSHLMAGNWLWKTGKESELRLQGNIFLDKSDLWKKSSETYLTIEGMPTILEEDDITNTRSQWKGEANYQYNGDNTFVNNNLRGYMDFNKSTGSMRLNGTDTRQMIKPHKQYIADELHLSHTTQAKRVYKWNTNITYHNLPGRLFTAQGETEKLSQRYLNIKSELNCAVPIGRFNIENTVGATYDHQYIGVETGPQTSHQSPYICRTLYCTPSMTLNFGSHRLAVYAKTLLVHQSYKQSHDRHLWLDPRLSYHWQISAMSTLSASVTATHAPLTAEFIFDTPLFTDYRTRMMNKGKTSSTRATTFAVSYEYANPLSGMFFYIQPTYSRTAGSTLYEYRLNQSVYTIMATDSSYTSATAGITARISKSFSWAKAYIATSVRAQRSDYQLLIAHKLNDARMYTTTIGTNYSLRPWPLLSLEGSSSVTITRQKNLTSKALSAGKTLNWKHELGFYFFFTPKIMMTWNNELLYTNDKTLGRNYFCDVALSYKNSHSELSVEVNNIVGKDRIERIQLTNTLQTCTANRLRPREFIVKWSFDIN
ncbi:hypothetical protein SAMN04487825_1034 [Prevotella sp. kh1p2]|nr:hypothetical protein SAMN04487825_1034 [Prevotella sp. kh1p2]SNU10609.1 hypothetical protein SAMN06298210_103165 [Prevotellaceae bacterium KH2P17]